MNEKEVKEKQELSTAKESPKEEAKTKKAPTVEAKAKKEARENQPQKEEKEKENQTETKTLGLVAKKEGMTRYFTEEGHSFPVTVVSTKPNIITQIKTVSKEGYSSIQVTTGTKKEKHLTKSELGHFKKASVDPGEGLWELKIPREHLGDLKVGSTLAVGQFEVGDFVDVSGISKGKGFAGTVKRWNFKMQDATHGNSLSHRAPGSIGQCQTPGRVWKGKKMSGHMGVERKTIQNLKILSVDKKNNLLLIKGSVPGSNGSNVLLRPAIK